jgi:hypothetical protein
MKVRPSGSLAAGAVTALLASAGVISFGFWFGLALSGDDVALMESPLLLAVARQLRVSAWELYGPFGRRNPLVLIHAPFYYRLAALAAWSLTYRGWNAVTASLVAGRAISIASLFIAAVAAYRLARLDGARKRAGWWSALLLVASPILGGTAFSVRPDMMGVALQTAGVLLVLTYLGDAAGGRFRLLLAFALFGLAICTKQQFVVTPVISIALLVVAYRKGQIPLGYVLVAPAIALAMILAYYFVEQQASGGLMAAAVFGAAANVRRVHPGSWLHVATVFAAVLGNSAGLVSLVGAGAASSLSRRAGVAARLGLTTAAALAAGLACLTVVQVFVVRVWLGWTLLAMALFVLVIVVLAAASHGRLDPATARLDAFLAIYLAGELVCVIVLSRLSDGAWVNYAIGAMVFAVVLSARALSSALEEPPWPWIALVTVLTAIAVPATVCMSIKSEASRRRGENAGVARLLQTVGGRPSQYFFAERPAFNRMAGEVDLVYDDWLYPVFEAAGLAESRSEWLGRAVVDHRVRFVVTTADISRIPGMDMVRPTYRFRAVGAFGPFRIFEIVIAPDR